MGFEVGSDLREIVSKFCHAPLAKRPRFEFGHVKTKKLHSEKCLKCRCKEYGRETPSFGGHSEILRRASGTN